MINDILWGIVGLFLTIIGGFIEAFIAIWTVSTGQVGVRSLGVTYQIGAVLLIGCLGGKNAGVLSQIAYLVLGLFSGFAIFDQGSGWDYVSNPSFGYLLGFIPGAGICGFFAFDKPNENSDPMTPKMERLFFCGFLGLITIHLVGISYLILAYFWEWINFSSFSLLQAIFRYSVVPFAGHLVIVCTVSVLSYFLRRIMFY